MGHDWMRDTMEEMRSYARLHGLIALEAHLEEASMLLEVELANLQDTTPDRAVGEGG